jgi:hypothetical protein
LREPKALRFELLLFILLEFSAGREGRLDTRDLGLTGGLPERLPLEVLLDGVSSAIIDAGLN